MEERERRGEGRMGKGERGGGFRHAQHREKKGKRWLVVVVGVIVVEVAVREGRRQKLLTRRNLVMHN